jgi:hypothetical protein
MIANDAITSTVKNKFEKDNERWETQQAQFVGKDHHQVWQERKIALLPWQRLHLHKFIINNTVRPIWKLDNKLPSLIRQSNLRMIAMITTHGFQKQTSNLQMYPCLSNLTYQQKWTLAK